MSQRYSTMQPEKSQPNISLRMQIDQEDTYIQYTTSSKKMCKKKNKRGVMEVWQKELQFPRQTSFCIVKNRQNLAILSQNKLNPTCV